MTPPLDPDLLTLLRHAPEGAALLSAQVGEVALILGCNALYAQLHGAQPEELTGQPYSRLVGNSSVPEPLPAQREELRTRADGRTVSLETGRSALTLQGRPVIFETVRDATARTRLIMQLSERALQDALTGLGNRRAFDQDLELELARASRHHYPVTVLMADLDGLKQVNDEQGHDRGDLLLRTFAQTLRGQFRTSDRIYRLGGDEFAAILGHADTRNFGLVLGRVSEAMAQTRRQTGLRAADVSVGCAIYPEEADSQGDLVRLADERMYSQKRAHHGARPDNARPRSLPQTPVQVILQRTMRLAFALLTRASELTPPDWQTLLEAAAVSVPEVDRGALWVLQDGQFGLSALLNWPDRTPGGTLTPDEARQRSGASSDAWQHGRPHLRQGPAGEMGAQDRALLTIPVLAERGVTAVLELEGQPGRSFDADALHHALAFAEQVATLLAVRRRHTREADRLQELEALSALNISLGQIRTPGAAAQALTDHTHALLGSRYAVYLRYVLATDTLVATASSGQLSAADTVRLPRGTGLSWQAAELRQLTRYDDARREAGVYRHEDLVISLSALYAPLFGSEGQLLGVLALGREASPFSDWESLLVQAMTTAAVNALERSAEAGVVQQN